MARQFDRCWRVEMSQVRQIETALKEFRGESK